MTDRDHFAAAALMGVLAKQGHSGWAIDHVPQLCWEIADAMLRERGTAVSDNCVAGNQPEIGCPVTEPIPKEKRAEVSFTTHDAVPAARAAKEARKATDAVGTGNTQEPTAYAVFFHGEYDGAYGPHEIDDAMEVAADFCGDVVPLYRHPQPALTDEEREALCQAIDAAQGMACAELWTAATLRSLLERTK